ncbi:MAG: pantoate--beta-alanine ligase [Nitrospirota bacterium]
MEIIRVPTIMQDTSEAHVLRGRSIGFVPTMGSLHDGHLSLVRRAREENDVTIVSIFVNPIQFGPSEDFKNYPRDMEGDTGKLLKEQVDVLFIPEGSLMYPEGFSSHIEVEVISDRLCGAFRPGHFRGVATVVGKLFHIVRPKRAYFGQKDYQQTLVIKRMARDFDMNVEIVVCPTVREKDGLAMSSRNAYLDPDQRKAAAVLFKCLSEASGAINKSAIIDAKIIAEAMREALRNEPSVTAIQYAGLYDPLTLEEITEIEGDVLLAVAVKMGDTRLIDNMLVTMRKER